MEIKKCANCGAFIVTEGPLCDSCTDKVNLDMSLLKNYFEESPSFDSISEISASTGVSPVSIQKYMEKNNYHLESNSINFNSIQY